jgi:hypothetical protein
LLVNPSQKHRTINLEDHISGITDQNKMALFNDSGHKPNLSGNNLSIGPEQMVLIGFGKYASPEFHLGEETDVKIPEMLEELNVDFKKTDKNTLKTDFQINKAGTYRLVFRQFSPDGMPCRLTGGGYPDGTSLDQLQILKVEVNNVNIPLHYEYDKALWSGLSWSAAEFKLPDDLQNQTVTVSYSIPDEPEDLIITGSVFFVQN